MISDQIMDKSLFSYEITAPTSPVARHVSTITRLYHVHVDNWYTMAGNHLVVYL